MNKVDSCSTRWQHRFRARSTLRGAETETSHLLSYFKHAFLDDLKLRGKRNHCSHFHHFYVFETCDLKVYLPSFVHFTVHTPCMIPFVAALSVQPSTGEGWFNSQQFFMEWMLTSKIRVAKIRKETKTRP